MKWPGFRVSLTEFNGVVSALDHAVEIGITFPPSEIADKLTISADTIKTHLYRSDEKLYVDSRMALLRYAQAKGVVRPQFIEPLDFGLPSHRVTARQAGMP